METYNAKLISSDFEESTMEFEIQHEFTVKAGDYVILHKADYDKLVSGDNSKPANCAIFDVSKMLPRAKQIEEEAVKYRTKQWSANKDEDIYMECENCEDDFIAGVNYCIKFIEGNFC